MTEVNLRMHLSEIDLDHIANVSRCAGELIAALQHTAMLGIGAWPCRDADMREAAERIADGAELAMKTIIRHARAAPPN